MSAPSPGRVALMGVIVLASALYGSTLDDFFAQDDFGLLSAARAVTLDPGSLLAPAGGAFPPGYHTPQVLWWTVGWWLGNGDPAVFRAGQIVKLAVLLLEILVLAKRLGAGSGGAIFAMWFFLLMPLPAESIYWLSATPLHAVMALAGLIPFLSWLQGRRGTHALVAAFVIAWAAAWTKEAAIWIFAAMGAACLMLPGSRGRGARAIVLSLALASALLYVALYLALPYHYPARSGGIPSIVRNYFHLAVRGWLEPAAAVRMAAHAMGLPSWAGWGFSRLTALGLGVAVLWSVNVLRHGPGASERFRSLLFAVLVSATAVLPYALSHVSGGRYLTDTGVWVALAFGLLAEPFLARRRAAWGLVAACAIFSAVTVMATAPTRETWSLHGWAARKLCRDVEAGADRVNRYVVVGFPEKGGYLRVWHMPQIIPLYDPSVSTIEVAKRVPDVVPPGTAVIVYSEESLPDRGHIYLSSPSIAHPGAR